MLLQNSWTERHKKKREAQSDVTKRRAVKRKERDDVRKETKKKIKNGEECQKSIDGGGSLVAKIQRKRTNEREKKKKIRSRH